MPPFRENIGGLQSEQVLDEQGLDNSALGGTVSPLSYLQVGQQLFNRELAQPEINYLQSLYGQDVDPTEMSALQKALAPNEAIGGLYQSVLGRAPDPFGQMYWSQIFGSEISPEERAAFEQAAAAEIAARPKPAAGPVLGADLADLSNETEAVTGAKPGVDFRAPTTFAENYLMGVDPTFQQKLFKPGSSDRYTGTFVNTYRVVNGEMVPIEATPIDIAKGDVIFYVGGAPGADYAGENRVGQAYIIKNGQLTPVGEASKYKSPEKTPFFKEFLLEGVLPMLLAAAGPAGLFEGLGGALSGGALTGASASSLGSSAFNLVTQLAAGRDPIDALRSTALSYGAGQLANQLGSMLPQDLGSVGRQAITQLVTTGKINPLSLATTAGIEYASDVLAQETGLSKASAGQLIRSGMQFAQGNTTGALSSLVSSGALSNLGSNQLDTTRPQDAAAFQEANASPLGVGALSPIAAEDEQIALAQLVNKANQAIADYAGPGNDLTREGLVSQLQSFGLTADQAEGYAQKADQQINMQRVGADVMNRYSKIDPEFGTPQLDRDTAVQEMVLAGFTSQRANEILNGIDVQNAIKFENKLSVMSAYDKLTKGTGTQDELRSAMTSAGYTDAEINSTITRGLGVLEGSKLTGGEQAQVYAENLPDVRAEIAAKPTFSEAFQLARATYGSNATFTWQGKSYSTATAEERPDLSAAGLAAKALSGDPQFQIALSENAVQNQRNISQVFADYAQKGGDLTREGALSRLESLGVTKDQANFYLDQADGKLPLLYDQFKSKVPTGSEDSYRAYILAFNELKNKGIPTSLIDVSGYAASGAKPNYPTFINAISLGFGMGAEAAGNTLKAFGTIGESLGFNTAQMSDLGRRLENIAQELYPQALITSEDEVKARFANAKTGTDLLNAVKDSFINNPGAVAKMIGVEGIQELPNIALALATGGASAVIRYGGMLAGLGLDVVESAGLQGAQKIDEGLAKGLSRADAVKGAVDDMKKAGTVTAIMTAAADKVPFGGTIAKTAIKGSAGEGIEEYVTARWTGASHFDALRQAAFGAMVGGPTEASLQGAGKLTNVVTQGDKMIGTYENGTKVTISEGAKDLIIDVSKPSTLSADIASNLTANLNAGTNLSTAINDVVLGSTDLSAAVSGTINGLLTSNADLSAGISDLTLAASNATGNTGAAIDQIVASLADNKVDLNANAGSVVLGALSSGSSLTEAIDKTLNAVTANGGSIAGSASGIMAAVSGDPSKVANSATAIVQYAINNGADVKASSVIAINASLAANDSGVVKQVVGDIAKLGNNDATTVAITTAVEGGADVLAVVDAAITNGADTKMVVTDTVQAAIKNAQTTKLKTDTKALGDSLLAQGLSQEQIAQTLNEQLAGTNFTVSFKMVDGKPTTNIVETQVVDRRAPKDYSAYSNMFAGKQAATSELLSELEAKFAASAANAEVNARTFQGTVYPTVEDRNAAMNSYFESIGQKTLGATPTTSSQAGTDNSNQTANLASVVNFLGQMGITPTNSMVADLMANNATNAQVLQNIRSNAEVKAALDAGSKVDVSADAKALGDTLISQGASLEQVSQALNNQLQGTNFRASFTMVNGKPTTNIVEVKEVSRSAPKDYSAYSNLFADRSGADAALDRAASNTARAGEQARTFNGTVYPTVEARNEAANAYFASIGIDSTGRSKSEITQNPVSSANLASVVSFLGQMGITPTNSMVEALMENGPTNAEVLQRIQTNPEILAAVAARSKPAVDTGPVVTGGTPVVTEGTGPVVTEGTPVVKAQSDTASRQDVENVLKLMNIPVSNALLNELLSDNATNLQVLQKIQSDPAIQALVQSQRASAIASQADAAINNSVSAAISAGGNTTAAVGAAIDGASTSGSNIVSAVDASVSAAVITNLGTGNNVGSSIETAISGALNSTANNNVGSVTVLTAASDAAVSSSLAVGSNPAVVIQAAVDGAVKGDTDLSLAAAVVVSSAVTAGVDPSVASTVVSNVTTNVTSDNGVTIVTSSTDNSTTSVEVSGDTKIVTVVTGNQVVVTETDLDSGTSTQTTTTTSGTNTDTFVHVVPPPLGGTTQGTPVITEPKPPVSPEPPVITDPEPPVITEPVTIQPPQVTPPKEPEPKKEPPKKPTPQPSGGGAGALLATGASGELGRLLGQMLEAKVTNEKYIDPLANLPKLTQEAPSMNNDPRLERYLDERGPDPDSNYYSYGKVPSLDEILGGQVMAQGGQVMPLPFMYAKGGLSRQDFRQGKHVSGPGDGQSDDIPAMLADGEFVFPADVVAALGNGSTKAGTQKLYEMMHAIRQRARSTKVKDLPPPALKSPLDYLKSRK